MRIIVFVASMAASSSQAAPQQPHGDGDGPPLDHRDTDYDWNDDEHDFTTRPDWSAGGCSDGRWHPPTGSRSESHPGHFCVMAGNWGNMRSEEVLRDAQLKNTIENPAQVFCLSEIEPDYFNCLAEFADTREFGKGGRHGKGKGYGVAAGTGGYHAGWSSASHGDGDGDGGTADSDEDAENGHLMFMAVRGHETRDSVAIVCRRNVVRGIRLMVFERFSCEFIKDGKEKKASAE